MNQSVQVIWITVLRQYSIYITQIYDFCITQARKSKAARVIEEKSKDTTSLKDDDEEKETETADTNNAEENEENVVIDDEKEEEDEEEEIVVTKRRRRKALETDSEVRLYTNTLLHFCDHVIHVA